MKEKKQSNLTVFWEDWNGKKMARSLGTKIQKWDLTVFNWNVFLGDWNGNIGSLLNIQITCLHIHITHWISKITTKKEEKALINCEYKKKLVIVFWGILMRWVLKFSCFYKGHQWFENGFLPFELKDFKHLKLRISKIWN